MTRKSGWHGGVPPTFRDIDLFKKKLEYLRKEKKSSGIQVYTKYGSTKENSTVVCAGHPLFRGRKYIKFDILLVFSIFL